MIINILGVFRAGKRHVGKNDLAGVPYADFSKAFDKYFCYML